MTFTGAKFGSGADFCYVSFNSGADFSDATLSEGADFRESTLSNGEVNFARANIEGRLRFVDIYGNHFFTETASLNLQFAQVTKPEQIIFHSVKLRPHWFVNVDSRKFEFTNVNWIVGDESQDLHHEENHHRLLSIAYRQLATNAEDNNRYGEASQFRYTSMDARRLEKWRGWGVFTLDWWYWLVSGYGERIPRATIGLLVLLLGFSFLFTKVGFENKPASDVLPIVQEMTLTSYQPKELPLSSFRDGLTYAMSAALFQRPEPKAFTFWAKTCVALEMIFVPLQAALLALAIRRRFMR